MSLKMFDAYSETSELLDSPSQPQSYAFDSSLSKIRLRRVRQFQCCICVLFLSIMTVAIIASFALNINQQSTNATLNSNDEDLSLQSDDVAPSFSDLRVIVNESEFNKALHVGKEALHRRQLIEEDTPELARNTPSYRHQKIVHTTRKARQLSSIGYAQENAAKHLKEKYTNSTQFCSNEEPSVESQSLGVCAHSNFCHQSHYRTFDGTCNNRKHATFGTSYQPFLRLLPAEYEDGISSPRVSKSGEPLPSARAVSLAIHRPIYKADENFTIMLAVFGQFIDHDITATALSQSQHGKSIACCTVPSLERHPECFPVSIDSNDPNFIKFNMTCMEFVRSAPAPACECVGTRQQLNQVTSFIDGSVIYGDLESTISLRAFQGGKLKMYTTPDGRELLPLSEDLDDGCNRVEEAARGRYCFATGDGRANENLHLTSMHLLWARQHNWVAAQLQHVNPHWHDDALFMEARKIIGAQLQHITYTELLPMLFPDKIIRENGWNRNLDGFSRSYNEEEDATASNVFATAAFRFAHTLIPSLIKMVTEKDDGEVVALRNLLLDPFKLYDNVTMDQTLRGALLTNIEANDAYFSNELKQHLFGEPLDSISQHPTQFCGLDLVSLNIQRGRDHGLPGYTKWRTLCKLHSVQNFSDLQGDIDQDSLKRMEEIYKHVEDIDLYTGALSEIPEENEFLGPTLTCLLLDQFVRIQKGDRYWYENEGQFTQRQLMEIRKTSLAQVICDNSDGVRALQLHVMQKPSNSNVIITCNSIPRLEFHYWQDLHKSPLGSKQMQVKSVGKNS